MKKHKHGFTLAEVLITLVIIGIIAAMTIPTLMNKTNEQETVVAVKKAYSTLSQVHQRMVADYGTDINPSYFGSTAEEATKTFGDMVVKYLNVQRNCGSSTDEDCWSTKNGGMYKYFDGRDWFNFNVSPIYYKAVLSDGSFFAAQSYGEYRSKGSLNHLDSVYADFYIDINGDKGPNTSGKDVFAFWVNNYGVVPFGTSSELDGLFPLSDCRVYGHGCTAWIVAKSNMDYLRKDVSW